MKRPTVILADDHAVVIEGLKRILADDFDVVATASDGGQLVDLDEASELSAEGLHRQDTNVVLTGSGKDFCLEVVRVPIGEVHR